MYKLNYEPTLLEKEIEKIYYKLEIYHPSQLNMKAIGNLLDLKIHFIDITSRVFEGEIIIDCRLTYQEQWENFAHELCHLFYHTGNQYLMIKNFLLNYQEYKADNFALHFCIPTFMLKKTLIEHSLNNIYDAIPFLVEEYNVTKNLAEKN